MEKLRSFIQNNKFNLILLFLWLVISCFSLCFHELWRDEAQVWCIVRDLGLFDVIKMSKIEGHPCLWYLILFPFAKTELPVISMQIISLLFVLFSVCILIFKSPFNKFEKIIILFSAGLLYYLPAVARNYSLIPVFLFYIACLYKNRKQKPYLYSLLIILLSYTHLYMAGFCLILAFLFTIEKLKESFLSKKTELLVPSFILIINFLILFFTFFNTQNDNYALDTSVRMGLSFMGVCCVIAKIFCYNLASCFNFTKSYFDILSIILFYPFLLIILFSFYKSDKKTGIICFCGISYIYFVFTKIYFNGILYQKAYLIFLILIFCFWIIKKNDFPFYKAGLWSLYCLLIVSCIVSPIVIYEDFKYNFSGGKQTADYIKKNLSDVNTFITAGNPFLYSSISAYLPNKRFYNVISKSYISYYTYSNAKNDMEMPIPKNTVYSIVQENIDFENNPYLENIFKSDKENISSKTEREVFSIYREK